MWVECPHGEWVQTERLIVLESVGRYLVPDAETGYWKAVLHTDGVDASTPIAQAAAHHAANQRPGASPRSLQDPLPPFPRHVACIDTVPSNAQYDGDTVIGRSDQRGWYRNGRYSHAPFTLYEAYDRIEAMTAVGVLQDNVGRPTADSTRGRNTLTNHIWRSRVVSLLADRGHLTVSPRLLAWAVNAGIVQRSDVPTRLWDQINAIIERMRAVNTRPEPRERQTAEVLRRLDLADS